MDGEFAGANLAVFIMSNGATPKRAWRQLLGLDLDWDAYASMGPRPNGRGDQRPLPGRLRLTTSFNGATPKRAWRHKVDLLDMFLSEASMGPRPNGRGDYLDADRRTDGATLQWGHAQTGVETLRPHPIASHRRSFNGATPKRAWRPVGRADVV